MSVGVGEPDVAAGRGTSEFEAADLLVAEVTATAERHQVQLCANIIERLTSEIDELADDQIIIEHLESGAEHNLAVTLQVVRQGVDVDHLPPSGPADDLARVLAQRGTPITVLEHAYRLYQDCIVRWYLEELATRSGNAATAARAALNITTRVADHINVIAQHQLSTYEAERDAWRLQRSTSRSACIGQILAGEPINLVAAESALGYRLSQWHLGVILWVEPSARQDVEVTGLGRAVTLLAEALQAQGEPLLEPRDECLAWAWLPFDNEPAITRERLESASQEWNLRYRGTLGAPRYGREGFSRTHHLAHQAKTVVEAAHGETPPLITIKELGAVPLMCADIEAARQWVQDELGPLARLEPDADQLRLTLREFLRTGGSYAATARSLHMHKNSVMYRIHKIENQLGTAVRDRRLELENALELSRWLGPVVLAASPAASTETAVQARMRDLHATP